MQIWFLRAVSATPSIVVAFAFIQNPVFQDLTFKTSSPSPISESRHQVPSLTRVFPLGLCKSLLYCHNCECVGRYSDSQCCGATSPPLFGHVSIILQVFDNKPEIAQQASECWVYPPISKGIFLTGPTAGGKTGLGIELAEHLETEIISVDSMAVYQDMNIGTAKPTAADCQRARHHLIDFVPPDNSFSLSEYVKLAHRAVEDLTARNKIPVFVGGTPLYLKGLLRGAFLGPPADEDFRREIADEVDRVGVHKLYERVKQVDPLSAHKIQPTDIRRLTRVLEVERATGTKLSHWQVQFENANQSDNVVACVLQWDRAAIHRRVNMRVDKMIADGLIGEVQQLLKKYPRLSNTARQAVGYKEPMAMLNDEISYEEAIDQIKAHTRQFVRRQEIWFRSTTELQKIPVDEKTMHEVDAVADRSDRLSPVAEQIIAICKEQQLV